jgi:hypothetical protein
LLYYTKEVDSSKRENSKRIRRINTRSATIVI